MLETKSRHAVTHNGSLFWLVDCAKRSVSESPPIRQYGNYQRFDASLVCNLNVRLSFPENRDMILSNLWV